MDFSKLSIIFTVIVVIIVYFIIFTALKIMNKDITAKDRKQNKQRTKSKQSIKNSVNVNGVGLEIINPGENIRLKKGGVVPLKNGLSIGRQEDNMLVLNDSFVSSHHARIFFYNGRFVLEDMNSTNGTILNSDRIAGKVYIKTNDVIKVGSAVFKVIG